MPTPPRKNEVIHSMSINYLALVSYGVPTLSANTILYGDGSASVSAQPTLDFSTFAQNWNGMPVVAGTGSGYNALALSSTGQFQLAAMTGGTGIYQSNNYGQTFTALTSYVYNGATGAYPSGTSAATTWYCAGMSSNGKYQAIVSNGASGGLYVSSNYGVSWTAATGAPLNQNWQCVYLSTTGQYQLACYATGVLYVSSNYGATWAQTASLTSADAVAVSATGQYMLVSVQGGALSYSNNYGATFATSSSPTGNWTAVAISSSGQYASATIGNTGSASGTIYYSTNYGVTWTQSSWASSTYQSAIWNNIYCTGNGQYHVASAGMLTANLAYYYRFNLLDQSGTTVYNGATNACDGTLVASAAISSATSKFATGSLALSAASSQYLTLPSFTMSGSYTGITFAMWINLNTTQSAGAPRIVELGQAPRMASGFVASGSSYYVDISYYLSTIQFQLFYCTTTATTLYGSYSIPYNLTTYAGWNHIAWVLTGSTWTIYLNGAVVTPTVGTAVTVWLPPTTYLSGVYANSYIGHSNLSTDPYMTGNFNDFRMYTTALTAPQVNAIYTSAPLIAYSSNFGANWAISGASTTPSWLDVAVSSNGQYITGTTQWGAYSATTSVPGVALSGGLIGNVGIGTSTPTAGLHIKNATSAMRITGSLSNTSTRPVISTIPGAFEIRGSSSNGDGYDDGFLRMSAGGGTSTNQQAYIDLSGYSTVGDMTNTIVLGTLGTERMRINSSGFVGIGTANPGTPLSVYGTSAGNTVILQLYAPNMTANMSNAIQFGKNGSARNEVQIGYYYVADNNVYSYGYLQMNSQPNTLCWTGGGNVGIGMTNPSQTLQINGTIGFAPNSIARLYSGTTPNDINWNYYASSIGNTIWNGSTWSSNTDGINYGCCAIVYGWNNIYFCANFISGLSSSTLTNAQMLASTRMTINPSGVNVNGNIFMGNSYQQLGLVGGNSTGYLYGCYAKYSDGIHIGYNFYNDNATNRILNAAGGTSRISMGYGYVAIYTGAVNTEPTKLGYYQDINGNVGIGTNNPQATLHVNGNIVCTAINSLNSSLTVSTTGTSLYTILTTQSGWLHLRWGNGNALYFFQWYGGTNGVTVNQIFNNAYVNTVTVSISGTALILTAGTTALVYYTIQFLT